MPRDDGLTHPVNTSRSNLAVAWRLETLAWVGGSCLNGGVVRTATRARIPQPRKGEAWQPAVPAAGSTVATPASMDFSQAAAYTPTGAGWLGQDVYKAPEVPGWQEVQPRWRCSDAVVS
jgi:hypothetical protein